MNVLLGSGLILLAAGALIMLFVVRTPRSIRNRERELIEAELAEVNNALSAFGRGSPIAIIKKPDGVLASYTRADFGTLVEHKRRLLRGKTHAGFFRLAVQGRIGLDHHPAGNLGIQRPP